MNSTSFFSKAGNIDSLYLLFFSFLVSFFLILICPLRFTLSAITICKAIYLYNQTSEQKAQSIQTFKISEIKEFCCTYSTERNTCNWLVSLSSKTYLSEDKMTKYKSD